jgi:DNA-directed RNA polymerase specialized sigma24 family protein
LKQISAAESGATRPVESSISDGYESTVSRLQQQHKHLPGDEIDPLVAAYRSGSTILELAEMFDCDRKTVIRYLKLNCVETRYRRFTEAEVDELVELYKSGLSAPEIGRRLGADPKTVRSRLRERGVQLR